MWNANVTVPPTMAAPLRCGPAGRATVASLRLYNAVIECFGAALGHNTLQRDGSAGNGLEWRRCEAAESRHLCQTYVLPRAR